MVVNVYDAAGQVVYRATHGLFMSEGALFLHVVRCDMAEDAAVEALVEWVEAVQQEAPGAVMGVVFTHADLVVGEFQQASEPSSFQQASSATLDGRRIVRAKRRGAAAPATPPSMPATEQAPSGESLKYEVQCPNKEVRAHCPLAFACAVFAPFQPSVHGSPNAAA